MTPAMRSFYISLVGAVVLAAGAAYEATHETWFLVLTFAISAVCLGISAWEQHQEAVKKR